MFIWSDAFGLDHSNFIVTLRQGNESVDSWAEFYQRRRLEPQLALAEKNGLAPREMIDGFEQLFGRLDDVVARRSPQPACTGIYGAAISTRTPMARPV